MSRVSSFVKGVKGGVGIDWFVLGAGLMLLGAMLVQDIYQGATLGAAPMEGPVASAPAVTTDAGPAPASPS